MDTPRRTFDKKRIVQLITIVIMGVVSSLVASYLRRPGGMFDRSTAKPAPVKTGSAPASAPSGAEPGPPQHVTRLANADERRRVADRIATAQAGRAHHAPAAPRLPEVEVMHAGDTETLATHLQDVTYPFVFRSE